MGGTATGERADLIVVDDPLSVSQADSDLEREYAAEWFFGTLPSRFNDLKTGRLVVIQQRLHERDVVGEILKRGLGYEQLTLPTTFDGRPSPTSSIGWKDTRSIGELLVPDRVGPAEIKDLRTSLGSRRFEAQYEQRPSPVGGAVIKDKWWQRYSELPNGLTNHLISLDCAFGGTSTSDPVVLQAWGKKGSQAYLIDQDRGQWDFPETIKHFRAFIAKHPLATTKLVESKANGQAVIDSLRKEIPGIIPVSPHESKEARVHAVAPVIEAGNVFIPASAPWVDGFVHEFSSFPAGAHDDQVDTATQALQRLLVRPERQFNRQSIQA